MNNKLPLVSVVVITYNSSKTVLETLESIKNQTYRNIELIISDDCSKDNTIEICKEWIKVNDYKFVRSKIITVNKNTGTAGNLNRGFEASNGIWIKGIAGDDILMTNCIESNIRFIRENVKAEIILSKVKPIGDKEKIAYIADLFKYGALELNKKELLYLLLTSNFLPASTLFIKKETFYNIGKYDENMPLLEDWPFWIKSLYKLKTIYFNNEYTVFYRMTENSISLSSNPSPLYIKSCDYFYKNYLASYQWKFNKLLWLYYKITNHNNSENMLIRMTSKFLTYINPMYYYIKRINIKAITLNQKYYQQ